MRIRTVLIVALVAGLTLPAMAELQQVEVGGQVRIKGNYIGKHFTDVVNFNPTPEMRWPANLLGKRPIGGPFNPNVMSIFGFNSDNRDLSFVEQRTKLNVRARFTDDVSAFIELDSYDIWGEDFRSQNYPLGLDTRANSVDDVEIFQAYIDAEQMFGHPLRLRVGRQELAFGSQWLVGPRDFGFFFSGLSFDAVRLTYANDPITVDVFASKMAERFSNFGRNDIDFYGIYASCAAVEGVTFDAYWLLLRDDTAIPEDVAGRWLNEWFERVWGVDNYGDTMLHTVGLRAAGLLGAFDFDAEVAYQFGEADIVGATFNPGLYGDDSARFDNWALKLDLGYTFDVKHRPRVFAGLRYYGGEDNRDISFVDWLNPFLKPRSSISFNRLFSNEIASGFFDLHNDLSNAWWVNAGVQGAVTESLMARFCVTYYETLNSFDAPRHIRIGGNRVPLAPGLSWWTQSNDNALGVTADLFFTYLYSEDLSFEFGWSHLFTMDGLKEGSFSRWNGLLFNGGSGSRDSDYVFAGMTVNF